MAKNNILLIPYKIKNLHDLSNWLEKQEINESTVLGIRLKCKLTRVKEFSYHGPRYSTFKGIPIYYNF